MRKSEIEKNKICKKLYVICKKVDFKNGNAKFIKVKIGTNKKNNLPHCSVR